MSQDNFVFFWGGPFSQWYKHKTVIGDIEYPTAEHFMMVMKATHFMDFEAAEKIMSTNDPKKAKEIGRTVKNFDAKEWSVASIAYVMHGNKVKFSDPKLKDILLATGDKEIVEASPYDTIWGIGLSETDPDRFDKSKWRGQNLLGRVLMAVRKELRQS